MSDFSFDSVFRCLYCERTFKGKDMDLSFDSLQCSLKWYCPYSDCLGGRIVPSPTLLPYVNVWEGSFCLSPLLVGSRKIGLD